MRRLVVNAGFAAALVALVAAAAEAPTGWVLIALEPAIKGESPYASGLPPEFGVFTLRAKGFGQDLESPMPMPKFALFRVPAGKYCVDRVRISSSSSVHLCRDAESASFEVGAGEFVNLGRWEVDIEFVPGSRKVSSYRLINSWAHPRHVLDESVKQLPAEQIAEIRAASRTVASLAELPGSRWYLTSKNTMVESLFFKARDEKGVGVVELHQHGSWRMRYDMEWRIEGDELVMAHRDTVIRARFKDGVLTGIERRYDEKSGALEAWIEWSAGQDPFSPVGFEAGPQARIVGVRTVRLPDGLPDPLPPGRVVVRLKAAPVGFSRLGYRVLWSPRVAEIIESDPPGLYDQVVKNLIDARNYTPAMVNGQGIEREWIETLEFPAVLRDVPLKRELPKPEASAKK